MDIHYQQQLLGIDLLLRGSAKEKMSAKVLQCARIQGHHTGENISDEMLQHTSIGRSQSATHQSIKKIWIIAVKTRM